MSEVLKWSVPVDGRGHTIAGGPVVLVDSQGAADTVCIWTWERTDKPPVLSRPVVVVGTGHSLPTWGNWSHIGSCIAGPFVWHVFEDVL